MIIQLITRTIVSTKHFEIDWSRRYYRLI